MAQSSTSDRIVFKKGEQSQFIFDCKNRMNITWTKLSKILGVNCRTLRDWSKEKKKMSYVSANLISERSGVLMPDNTSIMKWSDHLKNISQKGGRAKFEKYGMISDESLRKVAWEKWWNEKGKSKKSGIFKRRDIRIPPKDILLSELVGIVIGDGSITDYTLKITLDSLVDKEYIVYVTLLLKKLFNIDPAIFKHKKTRATDVIIYSTNVVDFLKTIGLSIGNKIKHNIDIPEWIKNDKDFSIACIRGLFDTDGCFFKHKYKVNGKEYNYIKIVFTNKCKLVLNSVNDILINIGICARITKDGNDLRIESRYDVSKYIDIVGTNNQKFRNKIISGNMSERSNEHLC